jgi:hypothetical protein
VEVNVAKEMRPIDETAATLDSLVNELEAGRIDRRSFITSATALGISVPAAIALASPASAQDCSSGAEARLEVRIASDYQLSDTAVSRLEREFQSFMTAAPVGAAALLRPKTKVKLKTKCICGRAIDAPELF